MDILNKHIDLDYVRSVETTSTFLRNSIEFDKGEGLQASEQFTFVGLFVNDQIYNYLIELEETMKKTGFFRHNFKKTFLEMKREVEKYNRMMFRKIQKDEIIYADITQAMEDHLRKHLEILRYSISQSLLDNNVQSSLNHLASLSVLINILCQCSKIVANAFTERVYEKFGVRATNLDYLQLTEVDRLSQKLANLLVSPAKDKTELDLNRIPSIMTAFNVLVNKMLEPEYFTKIIEKQ